MGEKKEDKEKAHQTFMHRMPSSYLFSNVYYVKTVLRLWMRLVYSFGDHVTQTPTPIRRAFPWQQPSMEQCARSQSWSAGPEMGPWGMFASHRITAQRSRFFWPWQQCGKHVPRCNESTQGFLKWQHGAESFRVQLYEERGELERWSVSAPAWSSELHCRDGPCWPSNVGAEELVFMVSYHPLLVVCSNTQILTPTHDITLECCWDVFKVDGEESQCYVALRSYNTQ